MSQPLSNNWNDVTILKLDTSPGSDGPYFVVQEAIDSNDPSQTARTWLLRTDGFWIDLITQFSLPAKERGPVWFSVIQDVMALLGSLPAHPAVYQKELSNKEKAAALAEVEGLSTENIRAKVQKWKEQHQS